MSAKPLSPILGRFKASVEARRAACAAAGHPQCYLNASKSDAKHEVLRCLCGAVETEEKRS